MQTSENIDEIAAALVAVQKQVGHVKATHAGNVNNRYASLADVLDTVRPALTEHGIAVVQSPDMLAEHRLVTLTTRLVHTSGQWIQGTACAPAPEPNAATNPVQMVGSAIRYLCRYGLEAMVGVAEESVDDADGQPAQPGTVRTLGTVPVTAAPAATTDNEAADGRRSGRCRLGWQRRREGRATQAHRLDPWRVEPPQRRPGRAGQVVAGYLRREESRRADHRADARGAQRHDGTAGTGSGVVTLRDMLIERESLQQALASMDEDIAAALGDPDTSLAGVKVTERRDIRVSVRDNAALEKHLFATGKHKLVISAIKLVGATEQELYDSLQMVQGVVGPTSATCSTVDQHRFSLKSAIRKMQPAEVASLDSVRVEPVVTRSAQLVYWLGRPAKT